jgi:hypothetical protein
MTTPSRSDCPIPKIFFIGGRVPLRSVLVVDDNQVIRKIICELFTREGDFEVCGQAENGREADELRD